MNENWSPDSWRNLPIRQVPGYADEAALQRVEETLHRLHLDKNAVVSTLSGGTKKRVALAQALVSRRDRRDVILALGSNVAPNALVRAHRRGRATPYAAPAVRAEAARADAPPPPTNLKSPVARELFRQSFHTSLPGLLRYADRSSMAWSRELRLPLLDRRIAEFAFSFPPEFLYSDGVSKRILRDVGRGLVPDAILARRDKVGYEPPQENWLADPQVAAKVGEVLLDPKARSRGLFDTGAIEADATAGRWRDPKGVWRALNAELWLRLSARPRRPEPLPAR